jgi:hypothetical protein
MIMERKIVCDLNLVSVDFGREEELRPGNTFRIAFRHANGQPTGTIEVYQGEAEQALSIVVLYCCPTVAKTPSTESHSELYGLWLPRLGLGARFSSFG